MGFTYSFEKMVVWQAARQVSKLIYFNTKSFPKEELFGMTNQIRRAAVSVCCNLAEGSARVGTKWQNHFYQIAFGSAVEIVNLLILANDMEYLSDDSYSSIRSEIEKLTFQINKLINRNPDSLSEPDFFYETP
jgi:four helix bundle protein